MQRVGFHRHSDLSWCVVYSPELGRFLVITAYEPPNDYNLIIVDGSMAYIEAWNLFDDLNGKS